MNKGSWNFRECYGHNQTHDYVVECRKDGLQKCTEKLSNDSPKWRLSLKHKLLSWLKDVFLPQGYPESVSADYLDYQAWDTLQAYCSSVAGSVSLHATLGSLGVGKEGTTALAATLTWLTNTGAGMVASIAFTYCKGTQLDSNNKQWRLFADVTNDISHLVKLATPLLVPLLPPVLPLTVAAVLNALVGVAGGATRTALTAHQAQHNNLGDVAAKDGSQETLVNLVALLTSLVLLPYITHSLLMTWVVFVMLLLAHVFCNHRAVRAVVSPSLNRPRLLLLLRRYCRDRTVTSVREANVREPLLTGPAFRAEYLCNGWSLELGCSLNRALQHCPQQQQRPVLEDNFAALVSSSSRRVFVVLHREAEARDVMQAVWAAVLLTQPTIAGASCVCSSPDAVKRVLEKAAETFPALYEGILKEGWAVEDLALGVRDWRLL